MTGIYTITNISNGKIYVGSALNIDKRIKRHLWELRNNIHKNEILQKSFNKYKEYNFEFQVLIECSANILLSEEHYWATILNTHNPIFGYNIRPTNPNGQPLKSNPITNAKISISNTGKTRSDETKRKQSDVRKGIKLSKESIEKRSLKRRGVKQNKLTIAKRVAHIIIPVVQLDKNMSVINEYKSITDAYIHTNINRHHIGEVCNNKRRSAGNFIWKYKNK